MTNREWFAWRQKGKLSPEQFADYLSHRGFGNQRVIDELVSLYREFVTARRHCPQGNYALAW